ncbi:MAG: acyltransferase [Bacteroidota bacterium]
MSESSKSNPNFFPALTGVRAIAAMLVFFHHLHLSFFSPFAKNIQKELHIGVTMFFVLSGLLITYRYYDKIEFSKEWFKKYFVNRFARIYPVYFLLVTMAIIAQHNFNIVFLIKNYSLTHALFNEDNRAISPSWSLTVEECFYLSAPFILYITKKFNIFLSLTISIILLGIAILISHGDTTFLHTPHFVFSYTFFGRFFEFYVGAFLALQLLSRKGKEVLAKGVSKTIVGFLGISLIVTIMAFINLSHAELDNATDSIIGIVLNNIFLPIPIALFYWGLVSEHSLVSKMLSGKLFDLLGKSSYVLYLLHKPCITLIGRTNVGHDLKFRYGNLYVMGMFLFVVLLSILIYKLYEEPLNLAIRKKFKSNKH